MRANKRFHQLAKRLDEEIEKSTEIFLKDRAFLEDPILPPELKNEHTIEEIEEKITNEYTIEKLIMWLVSSE